jgi:flagellar motor switch protein FliN
MAEEIDPFEAAMAAMDGDSKSGDGEELKLDDLEAALNEDKSGAGTESESEVDIGSILDAVAQGAEDEAQPDQGAGSVDPFDTALAAMDAVSTDEPAGGGLAADPFEAALQVTDKVETSPVKDVGENKFDGQHIDIDFLMDIKMNITFEVGRTKMFISDLLSLGQGSVIELHRLVGEELDMFINGELLATGEVVVVNEKFGARIVQILTPEDRINRLAPTLKK